MSSRCIQLVQISVAIKSHRTLPHNFEMYWSLWGILHLGQVKFVDCNQILDQVADQNFVAKFHM